MTQMIKFNDLIPKGQLDFELTQAYYRVMQSGIYLNGLEAEAFSHEWAEYCNREYCVLTASGLDGLKLILRAWGVGVGDRVCVDRWGCVQTWIAIEQVGAVCIPIEYIDNIYAMKHSHYIKTHLYGHKNTRNSSGKTIHDACQAHGLKDVGDPAVYSFYPTKNLGTFGDGGAIVTDDEELFRSLLSIIPHSALRMDELQCAFLRAKLPYLDKWNEIRTRNAMQYIAGLKNVILPDNLNSVWHQFVIQHPERNRLELRLEKKEIETMIHYPIAPHRQLDYDYDLCEADKMANEVLSLPVGQHLKEEDIEYVIRVMNEFV